MSAASPLIQFGSGDIFAVPQGTFAAAAPTPVRFGILQEVTVDFSGSQKELYGKNRMPIAVAGTEMKVTGSAKAAQFSGALLNAVFFGGTPAAGNTNRTALNEPITPASGTATVAQGSTFAQDLGVYDTVTGLYMTLIKTGTPTTGQYKVGSGGVYTFPVADTNPKLISYTYTVAAAGQSFKIPNVAMGSNPQFSLYLSNGQYQGMQVNLELYLCGSNKVTLGWKNADFMVPDFSFYAMDNGTGFIGELNTDIAG